jgi:hypothetical protein
MAHPALDSDKTRPEGQGNPVILMNPVMLSLVLSAANGAAKHLKAHREREPFAEFTLSEANGLTKTKRCHPLQH